MKIKFEIKLTASQALLAVLSALVGISVKAEEKKIVLESGTTPAPELKFEEAQRGIAKSTTPNDIGGAVSQMQEDIGKPKRTRTTAPKSDPIPEKIVPPAPQKTEEVAENLTPQAESEAEAPAITIEEVRGFGGSLIQKNDDKFRPLVMAVLQAHGASKFSELDPKEFAGTLTDLKALL